MLKIKIKSLNVRKYGCAILNPELNTHFFPQYSTNFRSTKEHRIEHFQFPMTSAIPPPSRKTLVRMDDSHGHVTLLSSGDTTKRPSHVTTQELSRCVWWVIGTFLVRHS